MNRAARLRGTWPLSSRGSELADVESVLGDARNRAVFLFGPAGVGKTRLATELRSRAEAEGTPTIRIVGTATGGSVPLAAVAHLLIDDPLRGGDPLAADPTNEAALLVARVQRVIRETGGGRCVVFVDDAHLLDSLSATIVSLLIAQGDARVVATVRDGEPLHDALAAGLRSGEVTRIDIAELSDDGVDTLIQRVLEAPVEQLALKALRERALGNMLYLRELVLGAVESGTLRLIDGTWRISGPLSPSARLIDVIASRLSGVTAADRHALELLAVGGPIRLDVLDDLARDADLAGLEERGVIAVHTQGVTGDTEVTFAHPLFGESVLGRISALRGRSARHELANAIESTATDRRDDALRVAVLRLEAGGQGDVRALSRGAMLARYAHDFALTARLGRAAFSVEPTALCGMVLGEALYELGEFDEAKVVLETALALTDDQREIIIIGGQLLTVLFWGLQRDGDDAELADRLQATLTDPLCVGALIAQRASIAGFSGDARTAMALLDLLPPMPDPVSLCRLAVVRSIVLTFVGRTVEGRDEAVRALRVHLAYDSPMSLSHPSTHTANEALALLEGGHLHDALARAEVGYLHATHDHVLVTPVWCKLVAGETCILLGRAAEAKGHYDAALNHARSAGYRGTVALALGGVAMSCAHLGDLDGARAALAALDLERSRLDVFDPKISVARATVFAASGSLGSACDELQHAATRAASGGQVGGEARLLHELARLGLAAKVTARLGELAALSDSALVAAMAANARAVSLADPGALDLVVDLFDALGASVLAAEAASGAAELYLRQGDPRRSAACARRAATLLAASDMRPGPSAARALPLTQLTAREREVSYLAAEGVSNKAIGERLFVSTRTVENHLAKVFAKLGVSSRQELLAALAAEPE